MEWTGLVVKLVVFLICVLLVYKLGALFIVLWDSITFLNIIFGGSTTSASRLHLYVCPVEKVDSALFDEIKNFATQFSELTHDSDSFRTIVKASYSHVVMARRRTDGSLQGCMLGAKERGILKGRKYMLLKIGMFIFKYNHRRSVLPLLLLMYHVLYELIFHPTRSVFFAGKCTTFRSYLSGVSKTHYLYPRYDRKTPKFEADLLHKFAESICLPGETYDREKFVLERESVRFKNSASFVTEEDLKNPHIRFFVEQNPGWTKGHSMFIIGQITWRQVILLIWRSISIAKNEGVSGAARGSKRKIESQLKKLHDRHLTYQTDIGKREVINQYSMTHNKLLHKNQSSCIQLDSVIEIDEYDGII